MRAAMRCITSFGVEFDQPLDEVEAHALHPGAVHPLSSSSVTSSPTKATPLALLFECVQRVDHRAVVRVVAGRLHDHVLVEAEEVAQREQLLLRRVARRVLALRREGKLRPPGRTRGNARRPRPPAAGMSASTDWDGTGCSLGLIGTGTNTLRPHPEEPRRASRRTRRPSAMGLPRSRSNPGTPRISRRAASPRSSP